MRAGQVKKQPKGVGLIIAAAVLGMCGVCGFAVRGDDEPKRVKASPSPSPSTREVLQTADSYASVACDRLAADYSATMTAKARTVLGQNVQRMAAKSDTAGIHAASASLVKNAKAGGRAWKTSASGFKKLCTARGWIDYDAEYRKLKDRDKGSDSYDNRSGSSGGGDNGSWPRRKGGRGWW